MGADRMAKGRESLTRCHSALVSPTSVLLDAGLVRQCADPQDRVAAHSPGRTGDASARFAAAPRRTVGTGRPRRSIARAAAASVVPTARRCGANNEDQRQTKHAPEHAHPVPDRSDLVNKSLAL
jgi:hypothetical protein